MTEVAAPPAERAQDVKRIGHWIGGRIVEGESGRSGAVYNPAAGVQSGAVDFATVEEVDRASVAIGGPIVHSFSACSLIAAMTRGCWWPIETFTSCDAKSR